MWGEKWRKSQSGVVSGEKVKVEKTNALSYAELGLSALRNGHEVVAVDFQSSSPGIQYTGISLHSSAPITFCLLTAKLLKQSCLKTNLQT